MTPDERIALAYGVRRPSHKDEVLRVVVFRGWRRHAARPCGQQSEQRGNVRDRITKEEEKARISWSGLTTRTDTRDECCTLAFGMGASVRRANIAG
jgi:hypothetical protein